MEEEKTPVDSKSITLPGQECARISKLAPRGELLKFYFEDAKTVVEALERGCRESRNGNCVGWRNSKSDYSWLNYQEFIIRAKNFGSGLQHLVVPLGQSCMVGIYGQNCVEWIQAQFGCFYYSSPIIPLYDTLGPDSCTYMINHGEISVIVCDTERKVKTLLDKNSEIPCLKHIICVHPISEPIRNLGRRKGVELSQFKDIEKLGEMKPMPCVLPQPSDVVEICYTSGTTGNPKGVILTHENVISGTSTLLLEMGSVAPTTSDVMISYLPLAHVLEQTCQLSVFLTGGSIGFFSGDMTLLLDDMKVLQPTYFPAVPRLLNKLYDTAQAKVNNGCSEDFKDFKKQKTEEKPSQIQWDKNLFKFFSEGLGNKVRLIVTAAAPVSDIVLSFYHQILECDVVEIYGQTETGGPCTANVVSQKSMDNVGPPVACCKVKLEDVPELGYFKEKGSGELCVKGFNVLKGYYKDPKRTSEIIDKDGWMHTGDIAMWQPNGTVKIIDRMKHIFKLSQGEYVAPEKLENIYLQSTYISQILIYGESLQSFLVAIVIPDQEVVMSWCKENLKISAWTEACKHQIVNDLILEDMRRIAKTAGLLPFEQVKKIYIHPRILTSEDGHLTPTYKTKRTLCQSFFAKEIRAMYDENKR